VKPAYFGNEQGLIEIQNGKRKRKFEGRFDLNGLGVREEDWNRVEDGRAARKGNNEQDIYPGIK